MPLALLPCYLLTVFIKAHDPTGADISGDRQTGTAGNWLAHPFGVRLLDESERPVSGRAVVFTVLSEPGENYTEDARARLERDTVLTDRDGFAFSRFRAGKARGCYVVQAQTGGESMLFRANILGSGWLLTMLLALFGGLALFVFGLQYGSKGLLREVGAKLRDVVFRMTRHRGYALTTGLATTVVLGSSTATAVLLTRFASSGLVLLPQALGMILGADIGTTVTVQLLAFNLAYFALLLIGLGVFLRMLVPASRNIAQFVFGIGLMFFALRFMADAAEDLRYVTGFVDVLTGMGRNPLLGVVIGAAVAFALQSSAATVGLILVFAFQDLMTLGAALPLVLGANLGTAFSPFLAAATTPGRRVACGHLLFKCATVALALPLLGIVERVVPLLGGDAPRQVANAHTLFNIVTAVVFLPLIHRVSGLLVRLIPETKQDAMLRKRLDPAYLATPAIALGQAAREVLVMADEALVMLDEAMRVFVANDGALRRRLIERDDSIDAQEQQLTAYLSRVNPEEMDETLSRFHAGLLHAVNNLEHIGDIVSKSLMSYAKKQIDAGMAFSAEGIAQLQQYHAYVLETLRMAAASIATHDVVLAKQAIQRRAEGYDKAKQYEASHLERLRRGLKESLETSAVHLDVLSDLERINFHASELAKAVG